MLLLTGHRGNGLNEMMTKLIGLVAATMFFCDTVGIMGPGDLNPIIEYIYITKHLIYCDWEKHEDIVGIE